MAASVREFYEGKSILITGATGFLGKALVEKYLRACPGIKAIYLLMRPKRGVSSADRLKDLCNNVIFDLIKEKNPDALKKLRVINGDILDEDLGLSNDDHQELIRHCNIVVHSAACVRFDQKLKDAVHMNTSGTHRLLKLAECMTNLEAFVHLSTAYCRYKLDVMEERLYPPAHKPRHIMDLVDWMDDKTLEYVEPKIIESEPNTYSYTKAITEDLVAEFGSKFPLAIGRPSIVTSAWKEPFPGWVDNINGPTGLIVGSGKGVIRTMHCEPSYNADALPVDVIVNGCILIAYVTAIDKPKEARIFNMTLSGVHKMTWKEIIDIGEKWVNTYPFTIALWYPGGSIKSYWLTHQIMLVLTHIVPAYIVDFLLFLFRQKTFLVKAQKRISHGLHVLQYYTIKEWHFENSNFLGLQKRVSQEENEIFFTDVSKINTNLYLRDYVIGTRQYVLKEDPANLPRARRIHRIRYIVDLVAKTLFYGLLLWFLYSNIGTIVSPITQADTALRSYLNF
ncbi:putative fatty acyl-CoA reductase CG5065 [Aricia agestis]|uniref:putative fatty acyl-CoA reductase CG5065 n=1 Tax=Aricia agestis TaxID=91739 RepID=UPI001C209FDB|nr:putative fatty acyl-CoA reductase CG5065 [Aricia agestis]